MANLSIKGLPDQVHKELKKVAKSHGQSLNSYIVHKLELDARESARRARMRKSREEFRKFVKSLTYMGDSTELIREDREHGH
jgi:Antitoxin FitA-like, ribbon-helix-helix